MERKKLINEIIKFYIKKGIINPVQTEEVTEITEEQLQKCECIENLINTIMVRTRHDKSINIEETIDMLNALDRVRLELEYYDGVKNAD